MRVAFRTDASINIGTGHVMRCLTLANALLERGCETLFICREHEGNLIDFIRSNGHGVAPLSCGQISTWENAPPHATWLGSTLNLDADSTASALASAGWTSEERPDWIVVDHYALDASWESRFHQQGAQLLVIDDLADRDHECDILLDQNLFPDMEQRYRFRVPSQTRVLLGPKFSLLRKEFVNLRKRIKPRAGPISRSLIFFGGADPQGVTLMALDAWERSAPAGAFAEVVVGKSNPYREIIRNRCESLDNARFHVQVSNMAELMANADIALGAGGTTTWERCCLGLPAICLSLADNQVAVGEAAAAAGLVYYLGRADKTSTDKMASTLISIAEHPDAVRRMSEACMATVDTGGTALILEAMGLAPAGLPPQIEEIISLREADFSDMSLYFRWSNDPQVRLNSYRNDPIPLKDHEKWFSARIADPTTILLVMEVNGCPAGQIRFQEADGIAWIGFSLDERYRGKGLATRLLSMGTKKYYTLRRSPQVVRGAVMERNPASKKAFLSAGFREVSVAEIHGEPSRIFEWPRNGNGE